jgi:pyridoxamine 5'-phosphate oxidase
MELMTTDPAALRRAYERAALDESTIAATWLAQLRQWYDEAVVDAGSPEPNAIQLATVDADGHPAVRTVLAKAIDERGIVFYTNYDSAKGRDLQARGYAAAVFVWLAHERQVRLSGPVQKVSAAETAAYFASRPRGSQIGAWASPQSQVIESRQQLEYAENAVAERFGDGEIDVPPNWGGFLLAPEQVEFWQGRPDRLHDRLRFRRSDGDWVLERLAP